MGTINTFCEHRNLTSFMSDNMYADIFESIVSNNQQHPRRIIHISHNDLDGYGCNVARMLIYMNIAEKFKVNGMVYDQTYNISKLNDSFYEILENAVTAEISFNFNKEIEDYSILITDIGGLKLDKIDVVLRKVGAEVNRTLNFKVYIIDHHRSSYMASDVITEDDNLTALNGMKAIKYSNVTDNVFGCVTGNSSGDNITCQYFYAFNTAKCGTSLLMQIMGLDTSTRAIAKYISAVQNYDTGKCSNWKIDPSDDIMHAIAKVDLGIILNTSLQLKLNEPASAGDDMFYYTKAIATRVHGGYVYPINESRVEPSLNEIHAKLIKMSQDYETFAKFVKTMDLCDVPKYLESVNIKITLPNYDGNYNHMKVGVIIDTEEFNDYNFTSYAKEFFNDNPFCIGLFRADLYDDVKTISMRSPSIYTYMNCFDIASLNGGGGHVHAAGFPIHMEN